MTTKTLCMIRRVRDIQNQRGSFVTSTPTLFDIRLGILLMYLRSRHFRICGNVSPI